MKPERLHRRAGESLSPERLSEASQELRRRCHQELRRGVDKQRLLNEIWPEALELVQAAFGHELGIQLHPCQVEAGNCLHQGKIVELATGEGKTLAAVLPAYLNALVGRVHIAVPNDYLASRDAVWMGKVFHALDMTVGVLQSGLTTEGRLKAFVYHPDGKSKLNPADRRPAYQSDIVYGSAYELGFDYLRDGIAASPEHLLQPPLSETYALVDEADNILIDQARTPLILSSGEIEPDRKLLTRISRAVASLNPPDEIEIDLKRRLVHLTDWGRIRLEEVLKIPLAGGEEHLDFDPEAVDAAAARVMSAVELALQAKFIFTRDKDYIVKDGKVITVDPVTGRQMPDRRWSEGLHQAVEAKEGVKIIPDRETSNLITLPVFFQGYGKLAGMSGSALPSAKEFDKVLGLEVVPIPSHLDSLAGDPVSGWTKRPLKDDPETFGYFHISQPETPQHFVRRDHPDVIYRTAEAKTRAVVREILRRHLTGQPLLIGTASIESSEFLSRRLSGLNLKRLATVLLIRHRWFASRNLSDNGRIIPELEIPILIPNFTDDDIRILLKLIGGGEDLANSRAAPEEFRRLLEDGIDHQVLNAVNHTQEAEIIAAAGRWKAVTVATNMAGRGVDIKLGGQLPEEIMSAVNQALLKIELNPDNLTLTQKTDFLTRVGPQQIDSAADPIRQFCQYAQEYQKVWNAGGLHVIGSERHPSRQTDNQLRGRAGRQGDPGSSQFFLSMEDDLILRFGDTALAVILKNLKIDESVPLVADAVAKFVEKAQRRSQEDSFDARHHLWEYDQVVDHLRRHYLKVRRRIMDQRTPGLGGVIHQMINQEVDSMTAGAPPDWIRIFTRLEKLQPGRADGRLSSFMLSFLHRELTTGYRDPKAGLKAVISRALAAEETFIAESIEKIGRQLEKQLPDEVNRAFSRFLLRHRLAVQEAPAGRLTAPQIKKLIDRALGFQSNISPQMVAVSAETLLEDMPAMLKLALLTHYRGLLWRSAVSYLGESITVSWSENENLSPAAAAVKLAQSAAAIHGQKASSLEPAIQRQIDVLPSEPSRGEIIRTLMQTAIDNNFSYVPVCAQIAQELPSGVVDRMVRRHLRKTARDIVRQWFGFKPDGDIQYYYPRVRQIILQSMTAGWSGFISALSPMEIAAGLAGYGRQDPLAVYRHLAASLYQDFWRTVRHQTLEAVFNHQVNLPDGQPPPV